MSDDWFLGEPGTADVSGFATEESSQSSGLASLQALADSQNVPRYFVAWKMAIVFEDMERRPTFHGRTHDLSLVGTAMLTHVNIRKPTSPVIVLLAPPPLDIKERPRIIEVKARQLDAVYSGKHMCFRLGFAFQEFKNDGFEYLSERLKHHKTVPKIALTRPIL